MRLLVEKLLPGGHLPADHSESLSGVKYTLKLSGPPFASNRHRDELAAINRPAVIVVFNTNRNFPKVTGSSCRWHDGCRWQAESEVWLFPHQNQSIKK